MTAPTAASSKAATPRIVLPDVVTIPKPRGLEAGQGAGAASVLPATRVRSLSVSRLATAAAARWPLFVVLAVVSVLAGHLIMSNTAFVDEANYLSAGHAEWQHWLHGAPSENYSTYFSGSPQIYPLLAAVVDGIGGLALVRAMSLVFMLVTICLMYATAKRLFNARAAGWAVAVFATVAGAQFLAAFATYDAMAMMLMALAVWVGVRFAQSERTSPHAGILLAVPILAFANATKYASGLFDPVAVAVVGSVVAKRYGRRQGVRTSVLFAAMLAGVLCAAVAIAGHRYAIGIAATTLTRHSHESTPSQVLGQAVRWIGWLAALSVVTMLACAVAWWRHRRDPSRRTILGSSPLLVLVLAGTVMLVPIDQIHLQTTVSLHKHVTYGGWYAAIAVGAMLATISGSSIRAVWRWVPVLSIVVGLLVVGRGQALGSFASWPNTSQLIASMRPYAAATATKPVLMDGSEIGRYYLGGDDPAGHWANTYFIQYTPPGSTTMLTGAEAFRSAISHNHFGLVAFDRLDSPYWMDPIVQQAIAKNPRYHYLGRVYIHDSAGAGWYSLWLNRAPETGS